MKLLQTFQEKVGFTRNEALAVLVLSSTFLFGSGIRWITSLDEDRVRPPQKFDYTRQDSIYAERSRAIVHHKADSTGTPPRAARRSAKGKQGSQVNINTADKSLLMTLPGIGEVYAQRIIDYRKQHGRFSSVEELANVKGIGPRKLEKLRAYAITR